MRSPSVRVLATARSDFLSRLAMLPGLGDEMARGLYFLRPLTGERIREAIVRPAAAKGVAFESEALVDTLVAQTEHAPGGLPLLQFTLAELWDARDVDARTIRAECARRARRRRRRARPATPTACSPGSTPTSATPRAASCCAWSPPRARGRAAPRPSC